MSCNRISPREQYFARIARTELHSELSRKGGKASVARNDRHRARLANAREAKRVKRLAAIAAAEAQNGGA